MIKRLVMGLSCGACLDGIQAALLEVFGQGDDMRVLVRRTHAEPFGLEIRQLLQRATQPQHVDLYQVAIAHRVLGEVAGQTANQLADRAGVSLGRILCGGWLELAACHDCSGAVSAHLDLGAAHVIAERTGLTIVHEFPWRDLAVQGQGSPISAKVDALLFQVPDENRLILHLSGMAQLSYVDAGTDPNQVESIETGPGVALLESLLVHLGRKLDRMDALGHLAVQGRQIPELFERWQQHPLLHKKPPFSLHRHYFSEDMARQTVTLAKQQHWPAEDVLCTAHHWMVWSMQHGMSLLTRKKDRSPQRIILTGRGVRNGLLLRLIEEHWPGIAIDRSDQYGFPADSYMAAVAGILACFFMDGEPANLPRVTGATGSRLLGNLTPGNRSNWGRCLAWLTGQHEAVHYDSEDE